MQRPKQQGNMKTPDYLTNFIPLDENKRAIPHMEAVKNGDINLQEEEAILNEIRKRLSSKDKVTD